MQKTKDIDINGYHFQIGLLSALKGDWILQQILAGKISDASVYAEVQNLILQRCSVLEPVDGGAPMPMKVYDGAHFPRRYEDLECDTDTVHQLITTALEFTLGPFFETLKAALKKAHEDAPPTATPATS